MATISLVTLQESYDVSAASPNPHITTNATQGELRVRAGAGESDIITLEDNAVSEEFQASHNGVRFDFTFSGEMDIGPATRPTFRIFEDRVEFLPTDRTITALIGNKIFVDNTITLDFVNASMQAFIGLTYVAVYNQNANPFGSGLAVNHAARYQNNTGSTRTLGPIFTFVHQPIFRSDGGTLTQSQTRDYLSQPVHTVLSGTYTLSGTWTQFYAAGSIETGATVNNRRCFYAGSLQTLTGTLTDQTGILIDPLTGATNPSVGIINNVATPNIQYQGSTGLWGVFGATPVGQPTVTGSRAGNAALASFLTGMANLGWIVNSTTAGTSAAYTPTNVTTDRSYDANATTLDELADVVGTMIADLQTAGIFG